MNLRDSLVALLIVIVWGLNFVAIKIGVGEVPPLLLTALRFFFTALPAALFLPRPACPLRLIALFGLLLGVIKFGLIFSAIRLGMPAGLTALVMQLQVFFTMLLGFLLLGERTSRLRIAGAAIAFAGIALVAFDRGEGAEIGPFLMILAAAFTWGAANIVVKKAGRVDGLAFLVWASLFAPLPLLVLSLLIEGPGAILASLSPPSLAGLGALAFIVGPSTLFAFAAWNGLIARYPTADVAPFALLIPIVGIASGVLLLGEPVTPLEAVGGLGVFVGLLVNVFGDRLARRRQPA